LVERRCFLIGTKYIYDCEYVVLAEELEAVLVTKDKEILKYFPNIATDLDKFVR